jgi:hypothetical protein
VHDGVSAKWFNQLDGHGLAYKLEGIWTDGGWCPFANLRVNTCGKTTEVMTLFACYLDSHLPLVVHANSLFHGHGRGGPQSKPRREHPFIWVH